MTITLLISIVFSLVFFTKEKSSWFSIYYLAFLPFILFFGQTPLLLILSLSFGYLLFLLFSKPSLAIFIIFIITLVTSVILVGPRNGLDLGMLNAVNAQRGEHPGYESSLLPKLLHNKADLLQSFINNFDRLLSPVAIFASGFWHNLSPYYPMGYLFPWDIYFIYKLLKGRKFIFTKNSYLYFLPAIAALFLLSGLVYIDQATVFSFGVIYFLAIMAASGYSHASNRTKITFVFINSIFLAYQFVVSAYFNI